MEKENRYSGASRLITAVLAIALVGTVVTSARAEDVWKLRGVVLDGDASKSPLPGKPSVGVSAHASREEAEKENGAVLPGGEEVSTNEQGRYTLEVKLKDETKEIYLRFKKKGHQFYQEVTQVTDLQRKQDVSENRCKKKRPGGMLAFSAQEIVEMFVQRQALLEPEAAFQRFSDDLQSLKAAGVDPGTIKSAVLDPRIKKSLPERANIFREKMDASSDQRAKPIRERAADRRRLPI